MAPPAFLPANSYVANGGKLGSVVDERVQNGPFLIRIYHPDLKTIEGHWIDGREYTLIYSENIDSYYYDEVGWNGFKKNDLWNFDGVFIEDHRDRTWGPVFLWSAGIAAGELPIAINMPGQNLENLEWEEDEFPRRYTSKSCSEEPGRALATWARPSSYHLGGVNVAFVGGRVTFLRQDVDYRVYIALMTLNDKKSDSPNPNFQLEDKHYR